MYGSYDILIICKGSTVAIVSEDHDKNLTALQDRCQKKGIKLNREKCQIATQKVKYLGHVLSSVGLLSYSAKIETIQKMPRPTNVAEIRRCIGMTGYLSRFLGLTDTLSREYLIYDVDANKTESMHQQSDREKVLEKVNMINHLLLQALHYKPNNYL